MYRMQTEIFVIAFMALVFICGINGHCLNATALLQPSTRESGIWCESSKDIDELIKMYWLKPHDSREAASISSERQARSFKNLSLPEKAIGEFFGSFGISLRKVLYAIMHSAEIIRRLLLE